MNEESYKNFYENRVDYSNGPKKGNSFYSELEEFVENFHLRNKKILEIGSGNGTLQDIVTDYTGLDVAESVRHFYIKPYYVIPEGGEYPFSNETFDAVFTRSTFEHIPNINQTLEEMTRVLKKGGYVLFSPAWQVRPWAAKGYAVRPYSDLSLVGKLIKFSILWRNNIIFRLLLVLPKRILRTVRYIFNKNSLRNLDYKKLEPNYETMWDADSDACNHIDPHAAILYFMAHDLKVLNYPNLWRAFFVKNGSLIVQKT